MATPHSCVARTHIPTNHIPTICQRLRGSHTHPHHLPAPTPHCILFRSCRVACLTEDKTTILEASCTLIARLLHASLCCMPATLAAVMSLRAGRDVAHARHPYGRGHCRPQAALNELARRPRHRVGEVQNADERRSVGVSSACAGELRQCRQSTSGYRYSVYMPDSAWAAAGGSGRPRWRDLIATELGRSKLWYIAHLLHTTARVLVTPVTVASTIAR